MMARKAVVFMLAAFATALMLVYLVTPSVSADNGGYLRTDGNRILNDQGQEVRITGVNWFGFETGNKVVHGLWIRNWESVLDQIADAGYNTIRIPYSDEFLEPGTMPDSVDAVKNPDLVGKTSLEIFDLIIEGAGQRGLKVILDHHRSDAGVSASENGLWYSANYSEQDWIDNMVFLADRYKDDDTVIAFDIHNEPHKDACWGCGDPALDWKMAAEKGGNAVLAANPNLLILVEGVECYNPNGSTDPYDDGTECTWWGGNLLGVKDHPIELDVPNRLVYSPHEYPSSVFPQDWFSDPNYPDNMPAIWEHFWGYIHTEDTAPLLFGEFGTRYTEEVDMIWFDTFVEYMTDRGMHGTYWSLNPNSGDTGGLLADDWTTLIAAKHNVLAPWRAPMLGELPTPTPTSEGGGEVTVSLELSYLAGNTNLTDGQINPHIQIANTGSGDADLSDVTVRYWLTSENGVGFNYFCDYAVLDCSNLSGTWVPLATPVAGADGYVEIAFAAGATIPAHQNSGIIQNRLSKSDWSNTNEADDYSFDASYEALALYDRITMYEDGTLIWGVEPGGVVVPTATSTSEPATATATSVPPTATATSVAPTATATSVPVTPTSTPVVPPTATATVVAPPTATATSVPPTATATSLPPTATATPPASSAECSVDYTIVNQWSDGFQANVTITNTGSSAIAGYTLVWDFASGEQLNNGWNATFGQSGSIVTVTNSAGQWNGTIQPNGTSDFGFTGSHSGTVTVPAVFTLNGEACD